MELNLGLSTRLINGYNASAFLERDAKMPFIPSAEPAFIEEQPVAPQQETKWDPYPTLSLHGSAQELFGQHPTNWLEI